MNRQQPIFAASDELRKLEQKGSGQRLVRDDTVFRQVRDRDAELRRALERDSPDNSDRSEPTPRGA